MWDEGVVYRVFSSSWPPKIVWVGPPEGPKINVEFRGGAMKKGDIVRVTESAALLLFPEVEAAQMSFVGPPKVVNSGSKTVLPAGDLVVVSVTEKAALVRKTKWVSRDDGYGAKPAMTAVGPEIAIDLACLERVK